MITTFIRFQKMLNFEDLVDIKIFKFKSRKLFGDTLYTKSYKTIS